MIDIPVFFEDRLCGTLRLNGEIRGTESYGVLAFTPSSRYPISAEIFYNALLVAQLPWGGGINEQDDGTLGETSLNDLDLIMRVMPPQFTLQFPTDIKVVPIQLIQNPTIDEDGSWLQH